MAIVAGFDVHRAQITFDALDTEMGEITHGRIDSTPAAVGRWAARFAAGEVKVDVAVEACTGWLFVCDALAAARRDAASGRAGGDARVARAEAPAQDRSRGRPLAARAARRRPTARGVDPARTRAPVALPDAGCGTR
jgi:hypothetical protein